MAVIETRRETGSRSRSTDGAGTPHQPQFALEAVQRPPTQSQHLRISDALRLLAVWAARAARATPVAEQISLDCSPHQSDECTPNPSLREDLT